MYYAYYDYFIAVGKKNKINQNMDVLKVCFNFKILTWAKELLVLTMMFDYFSNFFFFFDWKTEF